MNEAELVAKLRRVMDARMARDTAKAEAKRTEKEYREIEGEMWEMLDESVQLPPYKFDLGDPYGVVRFNNRETIYARVIDEDEAIEYFEKRAMLDDVSGPKFTMQILNEMVRDLHERDEAMPPGVDFTPRRFLQITREKD